MYFFGVLAALIAYFALRKSGGILKHALVLIALLIMVGALHGVYFTSRFPHGWTTAEGGPIILASIVAGLLGPLIGMLLAWSTRAGHRKGQIAVGAFLILTLLAQGAMLYGMMNIEGIQTSRIARQEWQARHAPMKYDLGLSMIAGLAGLLFCFRNPGKKAKV